MSQQQLIDDLAEATQLPKTSVKAILKSLPEVLAAQVKASEKNSATLPGVGIVKLATRKARTGKNPATGEPIQIAEKTVPSVKVAKAFKDLF
jgi:nucleoid DNA-binding protein